MRYEILPRFALGLGTKHDATGDVERGFSTMNLIHQNKQRNTMEQDTLNAHLLIRAGVEAKEVTKLCDKCKASPTDDHCHCELFEVTDLIRAKCKVAWQKCLNSQASAAAARREVSAEMEEKKKNYDALEMARLEKVKEKLAVKSVFCSAKYFEPVYKATEKPKSRTTSKRTTAGAKKTAGANSSGAKTAGANSSGAKTAVNNFAGAKAAGANSSRAKTTECNSSGAKTTITSSGGFKTVSAKTPSAKKMNVISKSPSAKTVPLGPSLFQFPRQAATSGKTDETDYNLNKKSSGVKRKAPSD